MIWTNQLRSLARIRVAQPHCWTKPMSSAPNLEWQVVATFSDVASGHVIVTLFNREGLPANLILGNPLLGDANGCEIRVPREVAHRARWILSQAEFTDAELTFLATGELDGEDNAEQ
jgi:hypothetical protein